MIRLLLSVVCVTAFSVLGVSNLNNGDKYFDDDGREKLWKLVSEAESKALPKTGMQHAQSIYESAIQDEDYAEAARALMKKLTLEASINQPATPFLIKKLAQEVDGYPDGIKPVMNTILANWFYTYYQQNRWRFAQRSQTAQVPSDDFQTWDLARILNHIDSLFRQALQDSESLQQIPIGDYNELIRKGNVSDDYRPTLFDFVAYQALEFYALDEQIVRQQGAFDILADGPVFSPVDEFLAWQPKTEDDDSFLLNAVRLYQNVLRFHAEDQDSTARLDANLHRLQFANQVAVGGEKTARYKAALQRFIDANVQHPLSAVAMASLASVYQGEKDFVKAHKIASQGKERYPESQGGKNCHNIVEQIESKELSVTTERVWNSARPAINVSYRNLDSIHFRMVEFDYLNWRWGDRNQPTNLGKKELAELLQRRRVTQWSQDLKPTDDYQTRRQEIDVNVELDSGCYLLFASGREDFQEKDNQVSVCEVWVSDLGVTIRSNSRSPGFSAQITNAITGKPIVGAQINASQWIRDGRNSRSEDLAAVTTDADGIFEIRVPNVNRRNVPVRVIVSHNNQTMGFVSRSYRFRQNRNRREGQQTVFFTDRSLYRPGQTINFKGICFFHAQSRGEYTTLPNQSVEVLLRDVNGQEVARRNFTSNEFGSFSGSFTAPKGVATGYMNLQVASGPSGATGLRVEEYKRPKFIVEVEKPDQEFRLGGNIKATGKATAYTGAPIDGAKVVWRVVREVRYPDWWMWRCWYCPPATGDSQEIENGVGTTDVDGTFKLSFTALPDLNVDRESEPVFTYTIYADVTDTTGETRSSTQRIRIGYTTLQASLVCKSWLTADEPVELDLTTSTLDGEGQPAQGLLKVYALKQPEKVNRVRVQTGSSYYWRRGEEKPAADLSRIDSWPLGDIVQEVQIETNGAGKLKQPLELAAGAYRAVFETKDASGQKVMAEKPFLVVAPDADNFATRIPNYFDAKSWSVEPGETFVALWGTGYESGQAYVEIEHRGEILKSYWTDANATQARITQEVSESMRGGFVVHVTYVRENRCYVETRTVQVPWSNKKLQIKWEHFVSKLQPGGKETWTAVVSGPDAKRAAAEMVATMYDASLDAFAPHSWSSSFNVFYRDSSARSRQFQNYVNNFRPFYYGWRNEWQDGNVVYRRFESFVAPNVYGYGRTRRIGGFGGGAIGGSRMLNGAVPAFQAVEADGLRDTAAPMDSAGLQQSNIRTKKVSGDSKNDSGRAGEESESGPNLDNVSARKNLNETAFFFPHMQVDDDGTVRMEFEVPEALTKWKFLGFAHDNELKSALLTDEAVTSKDLMVQPNPPRFLREGDVLEFSVKVVNQSATRQTGQVRLTFADARTEENMDAKLAIPNVDQAFDIPAGQSKSLFWKLTMPDYVGVLTYKAVGATERLSDGEEGFLPVLTKRILVTESLPLPIRGKQTRNFNFDRLKLAGQSDSLQSQTLTLQMTSNPAWYAVMSLPYLMEYPHQCSEQVFNRYYANSIGRHIVSSDPKIKRIFDQWRGTEALDSPLEKNDDIRNVLIAESPWLRDAKKESQARRDVAKLFEENRLDEELKQAMKLLSERQYSDGSWPWFPGGRANDYITLYITTGLGRLRHLGVNADVAPAIKALDRLDNWIHQTYLKIKERDRLAQNNLSPRICMYLYGRSFFLQDKVVDDQYKVAVDYFIKQAQEYWPKLGNRQSQAHVAVALNRFSKRDSAHAVMASLTERATMDDEMGMLWREAPSWWWYRAPIETQAMMIEAYDEVLGDARKVEECKIWMLKQKQTQGWKTTKATADACYALLRRGSNLLASSRLVDVSLGALAIEPENVEAGTGFYEKRFVREEIKPEMGEVTVSKSDDGIAWGSLHWQYLEDVAKVEPYEGTPLTLKKSLFIKKNTEAGPKIEPVDGPVGVGDELVTRVELRVDRDMEYVHLKDYRGSGTEPVNVLSRYKSQDGLWYYESTKDTASHFFIDYLPRGTYVFEYSVRVQHKGKYQTGIAELQCMYAPEFNSHSGSVEIVVQ